MNHPNLDLPIPDRLVLAFDFFLSELDLIAAQADVIDEDAPLPVIKALEILRSQCRVDGCGDYVMEDAQVLSLALELLRIVLLES